MGNHVSKPCSMALDTLLMENGLMMHMHLCAGDNQMRRCMNFQSDMVDRASVMDTVVAFDAWKSHVRLVVISCW